MFEVSGACLVAGFGRGGLWLVASRLKGSGWGGAACPYTQTGYFMLHATFHVRSTVLANSMPRPVTLPLQLHVGSSTLELPLPVVLVRVES